MNRKENAVVVFYTEQHKYVVFKYNNGKYAFPIQKLNEEDDNYCPPLGVSRHILTQISGGFSYEMLTEEVQVDENSEDLKRKFISNEWNYWHKLWMSIEYNIWLDKLSESYFSEIIVDNVHYQIYYVKIDSQFFASNMKKLEVDYLLLPIQEIRDHPDVNEATKSIIVNQEDLSDIIQQQEDIKNGPNSRENTYAFILHKTLDLKEKLKQGIPEMPTKAFYLGLFKKSNQKWLIFNAGSQYLPSDEVLENTKVIVQPGSSSSAYEYSEWTVKYREWIKQNYFKFPHLKFLSICFGEQILGHTLNGKCGMVEERKKDKNFYNVQIEELKFQENFYNLPYVSKLNLPKKPLRICKAHGDIVEYLDNTLFEVMASSEKYHVEVFIDVTNNGNKVLTFQGHPEYAGQWICRKDSQFYSFITKKDLESCFKMVQKHYPIDNPDDHHTLRQICSSFLIN